VTTPSEELVVADEAGHDVATVEEPTPVDTRSWWARLDKKLLLASLVIAFGVVLVAWGVGQSVTGNEASNMPAAVVELPTVRLDEVGSQDVEPGEQVEFPPGARFEPGNATLTFTPGAEQDIAAFDAGVHTVKVVYWKEIEGPDSARSYSWTFTVF
jgi:hypothetical protein